MIKKILFNEKIFIAGASGMAGSAIYRRLKKAGYGKPENGGIILAPTRKELDLLNMEAVKSWFELNKPTIVILAAARVGGIFANSIQPASFLLDNIKIETNVIEAAWLFGAKRLLFLGSSCIYPKFAHQPIREEALLQGALEVTNEGYALAKIAGIKLCEALRIQHGFDAISLMPTNLYGPGDNYDPIQSHVMAALIKKFCDAVNESSPTVTCWGSGSPMREFLHVNDLGDAAVFVLENWDPGSINAPVCELGKPLTYLNVGTGLDISIKDLANKIAQFTGFNGQILWDESKPDGTARKQLNINRLKDLGWQPSIKINEGIKKTVAEYKYNIM